VFLSVLISWALVEADHGDEALALLAPYEADLFGTSDSLLPRRVGSIAWSVLTLLK
jgi:hypothetical protein